MRRFFLLLATIALGLVIACGGGDDDGDNGGDDGGGSDQPAASASPSSDGGSDNGGQDADGGRDDYGGGDSGSGADSDFCSPGTLEGVFNSEDFMGFDNMEEEFGQLDEAMDYLEDNAPNEIEDDVAIVVSGIRGWIELLEENDFNIMALAGSEDDPRLLALESDEFEAASERVANYCGFEADMSTDGGGTDSDSGGSTGGGFSVDLPDDFPEELIAPDSTIGFAGTVGFGTTVEMTSTATTAEVQAYYEDILGEPSFADSESVTWAATSENVTTVNLTGTDGNVTILIIVAGG